MELLYADMAPSCRSHSAIQPSAAISRPTTRSMTAAASAQHTAANCANVKKRKLEDTAASGPAAKRATRRAAPSGPAASGPGASGPAANSSVSSGPRASGPAASGPAASSPAASGPAAKRATRKAAASGPVASGPAASGTAANSAARRAANRLARGRGRKKVTAFPLSLSEQEEQAYKICQPAWQCMQMQWVQFG